MLIIRQEQIEVFKRDESNRFKARLRAHVCDIFPLQTALVETAALDEFIDQTIRESRRHGFETEATVQSFVDHAILLGSDFCRNPLYSTLVEPLFDAEIENLIQRHDLLYERAWSYLDATRGPDGANVLRAVARFKAWLAIPRKPRPAFLPELLQDLSLIYPEKQAIHPPAELTLFCDEAAKRARSDGFSEPLGQMTYVIIAFLIGLGFFHDPLVLGAVRDGLAELEKEENASRRTERLTSLAETYLNRVIAAVRSSTTTGSELL
ncbi:hypothetical protein [Thiocystis violascens]|nr:hypothetical protein [Thiocystis violascens]